ncbi:hypothetical protein DQ392_24655 [Streptomyces reniochalinae]|uniref:Uncharacterized protein n=1 Tax=Streptomyces reniochalinae TaxID=2250578 RepID=A0A367EC48_9ACTN|nr:glycogen debranching N-terminal domain-containing protein [Streptomyces reniochalinae]RCG15369.1 hypothetical protein DQ392_24655 [Streptomyces reniochalinae]
MTATEHRMLVHDGTFAVLTPSGDIAEAPAATVPHGLFRRDARHLSRWELTLDGAAPVVLVPGDAGDGGGCAVLTPRGTREAPPACTVFREQAVADGALTELLRVVGNEGAAATVRLTLTADADFADQMELRAQHRVFTKPGAAPGSDRRTDGVEFRYLRGADWHARTVVTADPAPLTVHGPDGTDGADATGGGSGTARRLLWSGILEQGRGRTVGRRLMEPDFFSGWGVRTLAAGQTPYHPLSYHRGSVWPQDNALIALGLARYGLREELRRLTGGLLDAAARHGYRLPEVLAGYPRADPQGPVPYPHACSPQAWAAATPLALLTALDGDPARC